MPRFMLTALVILLGCATTIEIVSIDYRLVDHPDEDRIELLYLNDTGKTLCLSADNWPSKVGALDQMGDVVFLVVGSERFPIMDTNMGVPVCYGVCARRVAPGEEISASIRYDDFVGYREGLRYQPKSLIFSPTAFVCR